MDMKARTTRILAVAGATILSGLLGTACFDSWCGGYVTCTSGMGGASSSSTGASSTTTGVMVGCVPSSTDAPKGDACGVFVDPANGVDSNPGTIAMPKKTLGNAVSA